MPVTPRGGLTYEGLLVGVEQFAAAQSHDPRTQVGAFIVDAEGRVVAFGANRLPDGVTVCDTRLRRPAKYHWIEHAERNAIFYAARHGIRTDTATIVAPWAACGSCARAIIGAGITSLVRRQVPLSSRWADSIARGDLMLREAGVEILEL